MPYQRVMLVRCSPTPAAFARLLAELAALNAARQLLFFQGPGLAWAHSELGRELVDRIGCGASLMLCSAGWRRRTQQALPAGWELGSLLQFWAAAETAEQVLSFGAQV